MNIFEDIREIINEYYDDLFAKTNKKRVKWKRQLICIGYTYSNYHYDRTIEPIDRRLFLVPKNIRELGEFDFDKNNIDEDEFLGFRLQRCETIFYDYYDYMPYYSR